MTWRQKYKAPTRAIRQAIKLHKAGMISELRLLAETHGVTVEEMDVLMEQYRCRVREYECNRMPRKRTKHISSGHAAARERYVVPPSEVLREREKRQGLRYQSIVASILNDPLPGYSALDQRRIHEEETA